MSALHRAACAARAAGEGNNSNSGSGNEAHDREEKKDAEASGLFRTSDFGRNNRAAETWK